MILMRDGDFVMDSMVKAEINGTVRPLNYSIEVMFDVYDKFGGVQKLFEIIEQDNMTAFETVRWIAVKMVNDAELCRRDDGYDAQPMLKEQDISARIRPFDYEALKEAVISAIAHGYSRETEDGNQEVDIGLEELHAKKTKAGESEHSTTISQ